MTLRKPSRFRNAAISDNPAPHLPPTFNRLAWSNLAAQSAEQIALAAAPIVAVRALALFAILLSIWFGLLTLPLLAILGFIAVCGTVAFSVPAPALVPSLVAAEDLPVANARIELARTVAFASGPAIGGFLVGWLGAAPARRKSCGWARRSAATARCLSPRR